MFSYKKGQLRRVQGERDVEEALQRQDRPKRRESYVSELLGGLHKFDLQVKQDIKKMQMVVKDSRRKHSGKKDKKKRLSSDDTLVQILQSSLDWQQERNEINDESKQHQEDKQEVSINQHKEIISTSAGITVVRKRKSPSKRIQLERRNSWSSSKDVFTESMELSHWKDEQAPKFVPSSREFDSKNRLWTTTLKITEMHHQLDMGHWGGASACWDDNGHPLRRAVLVQKMAKLRKANNSVILKRSKTRKEREGKQRKNKDKMKEALKMEESFSEGLTGLSQVFGPKVHPPAIREESFSEGLDGFSSIWNNNKQT